MTGGRLCGQPELGAFGAWPWLKSCRSIRRKRIGAERPLRHRRNPAARSCARRRCTPGRSARSATARRKVDAARSGADLADRRGRGAGLRDGRRRQLQRRLGRARPSDLAARRPQASLPHRRLRRRRRGLGGRLRRCGAGRSATRSSSTAIRTTATTRIATAAIRCCRRRSASGATRRRTARSRSSAACSRAN